VPIRRVINGGGIPRKNPTLNAVYANVLNKPILVPKAEVTSLGSAIFAFLAAGTFATIEDAQEALCPGFDIVEPDPRQAAVYERVFALYRSLYFGLGRQDAAPAAIGAVLPTLRRIAADMRRS
jgi:L-ribulokinase